MIAAGWVALALAVVGVGSLASLILLFTVGGGLDVAVLARLDRRLRLYPIVAFGLGRRFLAF